MATNSALRREVTESPKKRLNRSRKYSKAKIIRLPVEKIRSKGLSEDKIYDLIVEHRAQAQKLAISLLKKWRARLDKGEVVSIVDLSICEAARRYSPSKGASFMTFLYYHLRGNLIRGVSEAANYNLVPLFDRELSDTRNTSKSSSHNSIANAIEVAEILNHKEQELPDDTYYRKEVAKMSVLACQKLDALEQQIVFRVILDEEQLMDVANNLGYSRCHLSRVKKKALGTLKRELEGAIKEDKKARKVAALKKLITRRGENRREAIAMETKSEIFEVASAC